MNSASAGINRGSINRTLLASFGRRDPTFRCSHHMSYPIFEEGSSQERNARSLTGHGGGLILCRLRKMRGWATLSARSPLATSSSPPSAQKVTFPAAAAVSANAAVGMNKILHSSVHIAAFPRSLTRDMQRLIGRHHRDERRRDHPQIHPARQPSSQDPGQHF
jgi:hypothetical protein